MQLASKSQMAENITEPKQRDQNEPNTIACVKKNRGQTGESKKLGDSNEPNSTTGTWPFANGVIGLTKATSNFANTPLFEITWFAVP
jgi:hypothetical protein